MSDGLEPTTPAEAVEWYLAERDPELSEKSLQNQRYRLDQFLEFCSRHDLDDMNALTGRDIHRYRVWRSKEVKTVTLRGELQTFRVFLEFCAAIDAVEPGMRERVQLPDIEPEDEARDEHLDAARADEILEHLEQFSYASRDHVVVAVLWHTGIRLGTLRALDVDDFDSDARCLDLRHRPESGTPLKNKAAAERSIAVGSYYCSVLEDYLQHNRDSVTDDHGRRPLITSSQGRLSDGSIRETIYRVTQPCEVGGCPHNKDPETCSYRSHGKRAGCPSSRSPHGIRRGAITDHLRNGTPQEVVSDRSNVSSDVLDQHYDERTEREKMEIRREFLEEE
ncbi:site-specific integrase [Natronomonas salina]|uniref:tyrosine-type recombinase/integrase n=1 Tax=Natronomonas salina TaxID=1710540 RepID=UPI0015B4DBF4|nr:tyrosine-type recombinase/integrase [Natronomonas salina]QLD88284.1 site-specific integrase [Natronomonas salina]